MQNQTITATEPTAAAAANPQKVKYLLGHPRQYRFDAKEGVFSIDKTENLGRTLTFQPMAWRIFSDDILNMGVKNWIEFFFIDAKSCVSSILFHSYSVDNIYRLIEPLYYNDLTLGDVIITAVAERKENNKITPKGVYYIATFSFTLADAAYSERLRAFATRNKLFRQESLTPNARLRSSQGYYNPYVMGTAGEDMLISAPETDQNTAEITQ